MSKRRTHSTIDRLPPGLHQTITEMLVDNFWPSDFDHSKNKGNPRYEDVAAYCEARGFVISASAVGRFGMRMRNLATLKQAGIIVKDVMSDMTAEKATELQKATSQIITAKVIEFAVEGKLKAKELANIAQAVKNCTKVSIDADRYIAAQLEEKAARSAKSTRKKLTKAGVNKKLIQEIIDEHLGVTKS